MENDSKVGASETEEGTDESQDTVVNLGTSLHP